MVTFYFSADTIFTKKILKLINNKNYDFMLLKVKNMLKFIKIKQG